MGILKCSVVGFECGAEVEVVVPEVNRKHGSPEVKLEGKVGKVVSKLHSDRTIDVDFDGEVCNVTAAWLRRFQKG